MSKTYTNSRKRNRKIVSNMEDLKILFKDECIDNKLLNKELVESYFKDNIKFKVSDAEDFIDYINKISLYEKGEKELFYQLEKIKELKIDRVEFNRDQSLNKAIFYEKKNNVINRYYNEIGEEEKLLLEKVEREIKEEFLYNKDIELLKKIFNLKKQNVIEDYDEEKSIKTLTIKVKTKLSNNYIKAEKGTVEYHTFLNNNLERVLRLIKNIDKYALIENRDSGIYRINQSSTIQDSVNVAVALFHERIFKAISGKNDIKDYCKAPDIEKAIFKSCKVNKLGQVGYGYNRVNDSEKKILEEIHKLIESNILKDEGKLILITKWEPCPSCYSVIEQFLKIHKNIYLEVKYLKKYGEL